MSEPSEYKKYAIVYVDDEEMARETFVLGYEDQFRILTASNAQEALKLVKQHADEIAMIVSDQQMPGEKGLWLLERTREVQPRILRILVTAYPEMRNVIDAINTGAIYKYITKPWNPLDLKLTLQQGVEFFMLQQEREELLKERSALLRERMIANRIGSLGLVAAGLSQHIRNSMVAVKTFLDLIEEQDNSGSLRDPDLLRSVRADIEKTVNLLADLRLVSAGQGGTPFADEIKLHTVITDILAELQSAFAARRIEVGNEISASLPALQADKPKFRRLFELIFRDELAMLPAGSRIKIAAEATTSGGRPGVAITVADNGPALPQDTLNLVLDPFATKGKPSEYGINLMICLFIVHHHGGTIEVKSAAGAGNTFTFWLPLNPEK
jgi:two-component system, probable response regulator PhcQ